MSQLDALRLVDEVRQRQVDFAMDDHAVADERLREICRTIWSGTPQAGGLLSDLWVEGAFPSKTADATLSSLARVRRFDATLQSHLDTPDRMPGSRPLYTHQAQAIHDARSMREAPQRPALVVTAGTGAGKTESFLLPVLDDLYSHPRDGASGVPCIILYPMNALVNDQVDRLYGWLQGQQRVSLFHFTSETPENTRRADKDGVPRWEPCRMRTRQEARGLESHDGRPLDPNKRGPVPDIVITNYSMLEYMLCRPQDAVFFGPALRALVLDEAHLYTGTLAAEITLLLRRLFLRCEVEADRVLQIATSATLGRGNAEELREFARTVFTKSWGLIGVIEGEQDQGVLPDEHAPEVPATAATFADLSWPDRPLIEADTRGDMQLAVDAGLCARLRDDLLPRVVARSAVQAVDPAIDRPADLLYRTLASAPILHRLHEVLWCTRRLPLVQLSQKLWGAEDAASVRATVTLLRLAASARDRVGTYPLVPHRIHLLVRPAEGLTLCLNRDCAGDTTRRLLPWGLVQSGDADHCGACGGATLALYRCGNCGEWLLAGVEGEGRLRPPLPHAPTVAHYTTREGVAGEQIVLRTETGELAGTGAPGVRLTRIASCPSCEAGAEEFRAFASGPALALSILAETVLAALPEYPSPNNIFLPAQGRRLLAFSDSRQEAARLGPRLTYQHERQLIRTAIVRQMSESPAADAQSLADIREELQGLERVLADQTLSPAQRQRKERDRDRLQRELREASAGGSIDAWAKGLAESTMLDQVLDPEQGKQQHAVELGGAGPRPWSQQDWEKNGRQIRSAVASYLGREFANPIRSARTVETLGFAEITYPGLSDLTVPGALLGALATRAAREALSGCWTDFLAALCDTLRMDGAITLGSVEEDQRYDFGPLLIGRWATRDTDQGRALVRFIGKTERQRRRRFATALLARCGLTATEATEMAPDLLAAAFDQLFERARSSEAGADSEAAFLWLERGQRGVRDAPPAEGMRLRFPNLGLRRPPALYRCTVTGHVWPRSVQGCAPEAGCVGTLEPVAEEALDRDPRIGRQRREYRESPIFRMGLWADEHSAQLSPGENRRLQDLFKAGIRNILSATTTLELGIDIGGLNGVLMGNVPPGKANYLQRAGRAGRRADGSAVVVTFVRPRPFDLAVFHNIGDYLGRDLRRPVIFLDRERVVRRHLHALLLNSFFQAVYPPDAHVGAMQAFGNMGRFAGVAAPERWARVDRPADPAPVPLDEVAGAAHLPWWRPAAEAPSLAAQFRSYLSWLRRDGRRTLDAAVTSLFSSTACAGLVREWEALFDAVAERFAQAIDAWQRDYDELMEAWKASADRAQVNAIRYQLAAVCELTVIEALADRQFLPHYGFPIGLQKLRVIEPDPERPMRIREEDQYRLERASLLALREYVPGSQLLVGGKLVSSHGLLKHWTGATIDNYLGKRGECRTCLNGHFYYSISGATGTCPVCKAEPKGNAQYLLFPSHGFTGAAWDPPKWSMDVERIGNAQTATMTFTQGTGSHGSSREVEHLGGVQGVRAAYREDGQLLVYNSGEQRKGFAICLGCGYAESEDHVDSGAMKLPGSFARHAPITHPSPWKVCRTEQSQAPLRNQILAAHETTDVLLVDFWGALGNFAADRALITTLGHALQRAGAHLLELDSRELGVLIVPVGSDGARWGAVLYDNVPGGAGHVRELLPDDGATGGADREWLERARQALYVDEEHDARCESACLQCLLAFDAQQAMTDGMLARRRAHRVLASLLDGTPLDRGGSGHTADHERTSNPTLPPPRPQRSVQERLQRAERQKRR